MLNGNKKIENLIFGLKTALYLISAVSISSSYLLFDTSIGAYINHGVSLFYIFLSLLIALISDILNLVI